MLADTDLENYILEAEKVLVTLLKEWRPRLLDSHGVQKFEYKADKSVVTKLDLELETAIKEALRPLSDAVGFVGEEHGQEGDENTFWFVDPIDGTEQYVRGMEGCRTLLTLIVGGEPVYAFAYRFTTDDLFTAVKGKGVFKNGKKIERVKRPLDRCWIEVASSYKDTEVLLALGNLSRAVNSLVYTKEFLNIVEGFIDGYLVLGHLGKEWDYAPRALMLSELGLKVTNVGKDTYNYKELSLLAIDPEYHEQIQSLLSPQA